MTPPRFWHGSDAPKPPVPSKPPTVDRESTVSSTPSTGVERGSYKDFYTWLCLVRSYEHLEPILAPCFHMVPSVPPEMGVSTQKSITFVSDKCGV